MRLEVARGALEGQQCRRIGKVKRSRRRKGETRGVSSSPTKTWRGREALAWIKESRKWAHERRRSKRDRQTWPKPTSLNLKLILLFLLSSLASQLPELDTQRSTHSAPPPTMWLLICPSLGHPQATLMIPPPLCASTSKYGTNFTPLVVSSSYIGQKKAQTKVQLEILGDKTTTSCLSSRIFWYLEQ